MALNTIQLGNRIRSVRKKRGLSQEALSREIGCNTSYLSYIENGTRCMSFEMFVKIANTLNVSADELLFENLSNNIRATNHEFSQLLNDCSEYEKRILMDIVTAAKASMRENKRLFQNRRSR